MTNDAVLDLLNKAQQGAPRPLSQLITLLESQSPDDFKTQLFLLQSLKKIPLSMAKVIGISGVPGAGKSTFIEHFGTFILNKDPKARMAVLTVDPASERSGGSLLADKTRMTELSGNPRAFIRPSSNIAQTGGLHPATPLTLALLKRMNFTHIFIESVGVGQSEIDLKHICDSFWVLLAPGLGDDLQALKKGILDVADALIITKADVDEALAKQTVSLYAGRNVFLSAPIDIKKFEHIQCFAKDISHKHEDLEGLIDGAIKTHLLKQIEVSPAFKAAIEKVKAGENIEGFTFYDLP